MKGKHSAAMRLLLFAAVMGLLTSCAVLTRSTEGTSETLQNTTEASTDFTSSTSPRDETRHTQAQKVQLFASANLDRIREDMARGGGEHLGALAHLMGVAQSGQPEFFTLTRQNYGKLFSEESTSSDLMLARLNAELDAHPSLRR